VKGGKFVVVVVVADPPPAGRHWIVTDMWLGNSQEEL